MYQVPPPLEELRIQFNAKLLAIPEKQQESFCLAIWREYISKEPAKGKLIPAVKDFMHFVATTHSLKPTEQQADGLTPLHTAAMKGYDLYLQALLEKGDSDVNIKSSNRTILPIHLACDYGRFACFQLLVENDADLNAPDDNGSTVLHSAAARGDIAMINLILASDKFTALLLRNHQGNNGLHTALMNNQIAVAAILFPKLKNTLGAGNNTVLHTAAAVTGDEPFNFVLEHLDHNELSSMLNAVGGYRTVLILAINRKNAHRVEVLLQRGALILNYSNASEPDALSYAAENYFNKPFDANAQAVFKVLAREALAQGRDDWSMVIYRFNRLVQKRGTQQADYDEFIKSVPQLMTAKRN